MPANCRDDATAVVTRGRKLEKQPTISEDEKTITISDDIAERLRFGGESSSVGVRVDNVDDDDDDDDSCRIEELARLDEAHSLRNNLDIAQAERILNHLIDTHARRPASSSSAPSDVSGKNTAKLTECLETYRGQSLRCNETVRVFVENVDRSMYEAVRSCNDSDALVLRVKNTPTFTEKFRRSYLRLPKDLQDSKDRTAS